MRIEYTDKDSKTGAFMAKRKQQSFLHGATILVAATLLVKVIGAIYKIPLGNMIGTVGMKYFSNAYDLYLPIYSLAMAGLPTAVSRIVAQCMSQQRFRDAHRTFLVAKRLFLITGITSFVIMLIAALPFVSFINSRGSLYAILAVAPSILFCCIMSSYRGYYEGQRNMTPTAVSNIIEALGKLVIGLGLTYVVISMGMSQYKDTGKVFGKLIEGETQEIMDRAASDAIMPYAAAAAVLGITLGSLAGAVYFVILHKVKGDAITREELRTSPPPISGTDTLKVLLFMAIPVAIGSLGTQISNLVDVLVVQTRLDSLFENHPDEMAAIYGELLSSVTQKSSSIYGTYKGFAFTIYNLVPTIASVIGVSALPAVTYAWVKRNRAALKTNIESVMRITALVAFPSGLGISVLSNGILNLLYSSKEPYMIIIATPLVRVMGITAMLSSFCMPLTSILQAIGKQYIPVRNLLIGAAVKGVTSYILVGIPSININGAPYGTLFCYAIIVLLNFLSVCKYTKITPNLTSVIIKPLACALCCGAAAWISSSFIQKISPTIGKISTLLAIAVAGIIYIVALLLFKAISRDDVLMFPKGEKIADWLEKHHLIG